MPRVTPIEVPASELIVSKAIFPTLVISLSLNDVPPKLIVPVAVRLEEPTSMFPKPLVILPESNAPVATILLPNLASITSFNVEPFTVIASASRVPLISASPYISKRCHIFICIYCYCFTSNNCTYC